MKRLAVFVIVSGTAVMCAGAEEMPTSAELIERYSQALEATGNLTCHYERTSDCAYRIQGGRDQNRAVQRHTIRQDGRRLYYQIYTWGDFNHKLKDLPEDEPYYHCFIAGDTMCYQNNRHVGHQVGSAVWRRREHNKEFNLSRSFGICYLVGYFESDRRLDAVLREAESVRVRENTEMIGGSKCYVLDANTQHGRIVMWLDAEHGYHPAKVLQSAEEGDYSYTRRLEKRETARSFLQNVRFEQVGDVWMPVEADAGHYRYVMNGDFVRESYHVKLTDVVLNPDHERLGSFADPIYENPANDPELVDGSKVRIAYTDREYTWQDGKLVERQGMP